MFQGAAMVEIVRAQVASSQSADTKQWASTIATKLKEETKQDYPVEVKSVKPRTTTTIMS